MKKDKKFTWADYEKWAKNGRVNKELDKYEHKSLFPEKLAKANEILKKYGLPK
jgi:hypothetical protein